MTKNTKNIVILTVIFVILVLVYTIATVTKPQSQQRKKVSQPLIGTVDIANVEGIGTSEKFVLKKLNNIWTLTREEEDVDVKNYPVNQDIVQSFLNTVAKVKKGRLVSKDPKDVSQYQLGDTAYSLVLSAEDGSQLISLRVSDASGANSFAQIDDSPSVYQIDDTMVSYLQYDYLDWADLRLFPSNNAVENVSQYQIQRYDDKTKVLSSTMLLERNDEGWSLVGSDKKIDAVLAEKYLTDMFFLEAKDLTSVALQEETKSISIKVTQKSGDALELDIYFFADTYYAKTKGGRDTVAFILNNSTVEDRFLVDDDHFFAQEPEENEEAMFQDSEQTPPPVLVEE